MARPKPKQGLRERRGAAADPHQLLPLHHRIYLVLRRKLIEGFYPADHPIPGEHQLAESFGVSRVTVRRVLDRLEKERLIDRRHGAGTFPLRQAAAETLQPEMSYYDFIAASSHAYEADLIEFSHLPTPKFLTRVDARFGAVALKIVRVAHSKGSPLHVFRTYVPSDLAEHLSRRAIGNKTVLELLEKAGVVAESSELRIGAMAADADESRLLKISVGTPLVHAIRISRLGSGRAVEYNEMSSVADRFGYRFLFDRSARAVPRPAST